MKESKKISNWWSEFRRSLAGGVVIILVGIFITGFGFYNKTNNNIEKTIEANDKNSKEIHEVRMEVKEVREQVYELRLMKKDIEYIRESIDEIKNNQR